MSSSEDSDDEPNRTNRTNRQSSDDSASDSDAEPVAQQADSASSDDENPPVASQKEDSASDAEAPASDAEAPASDAEAPASDAEAPASDAEAPASDAEAPAQNDSVSDDGQDDISKKSPKMMSDSDDDGEQIIRKRKPDFIADSEADEGDSDDEGPKKKKQKQKYSDDDDDEEEEMGEDVGETGNIKGLIASEEDEGSNSGDQVKKKKKRRPKRRLSEERLDDDDLDLIEENMGVRLNRSKKFERVRVDDDSDQEEGDKEKVAKEIFDDEYSGMLDDEEVEPKNRRRNEKDDFDVGSDGDSDASIGEPFIVDDHGNPIKNRGRGKSRNEAIDDDQLREAHDIFGPDFDPNEFENEEVDDDQEYSDDDDEYGDEQRRKKKVTVTKKKIYDVYEPEDLERGYYTDYDRFLRVTDFPERFLDRAIAVEDCECMIEDSFAELSQIKKLDAIERELEKEARWIYENAFGRHLTDQSFDHPVKFIEADEEPYEDERNRYKVKKIPVKCHTWPHKDLRPDEDDQFIYAIDWQEAKFSEDPAERERYVMEYGRKHNTFLYKIFKCLYSIRVQKYEPAFINKYRQEEMVMIDTSDGGPRQKWYQRADGVPTELPDINEENKDKIIECKSLQYTDIHRIFRWDEKYLKFLKKKNALKKLFTRMQDYQYEMAENNIDLTPGTRSLKPEDIDKIDNCMNMEELDDHFEHFQLHHGRDVQKMNELTIKNGENEFEGESKGMKQSQRNTDYNLCLKNKLHLVAKEFGLTPDQFAEHVKDEFSSHDILQEQEDPETFAFGFTTDQFDSPDRVLKGARYMAAQQLAAEPEIRKKVRKDFELMAKISTKLTKKGEKFIDEDHGLYQMRFLEDKPIGTLHRSQFIQLVHGEQEKFIEMKIGLKKEESKYLVDHNGIPEMVDPIADQLIQLYWKDQHDLISKKWNEERKKLILELLNNILYPSFIKKLKLKLIEEAEEGIIAQCREKFKDIISQGPIINQNAIPRDGSNEGSESDWDRNLNDGNIMALVPSDDLNVPLFAVILKKDGEIQCYRKYPMVLARAFHDNHPHFKSKEENKRQLRELIEKERPFAIVIAAKNQKSMELQRILHQLLEEVNHELPDFKCTIEMRDSMVSKVYSVSTRAEEEFPNFPQELREAISLGRHSLDPAIEVAQLFNQDDDVLCLQLSPFQTLLRKERIKESLKVALDEEMQYEMCDIGVDINKCVAYSHQAGCLQFVAGLGPRKSDGLIKHYKRTNTRLETLDQLISDKGIQMRKFVFINCSGFIKIDTTEMGDSGPDIYIEVLDGSRIHPEHYPWARKMAVDAMCNDDDDPEDTNDMEAIESILDDPEKLKNLDLEVFNSDIFLQNQRDIHSGNKILTLYNVREELFSRFKDKRKPHRPLTSDERFFLITGENTKSFYINKLVTGTVNRFKYRPVEQEKKDMADPQRVEGSDDQWMCPFCKKKDFFELSQVWSHFDATDPGEKCPGECIGIEIRLENNLYAIIFNRDISSAGDVEDPTSRVKIDQVVTGRITKIDYEKFRVAVSTKSDVLQDKQGLFKLKDDDYTNTALKDKILSEFTKQPQQQKGAAAYIKRVIAHENFQNLNFQEAVLKLNQRDQGDCIIRPSSKGPNHLTASWKMHTDIINHVDIIEQDKPNNYSLGKTLIIQDEVFEDLDEIIANYIEPMASNARDLLSHKNFIETGGDRTKMETLIRRAKTENSSRIPYFVTACGKAAKDPRVEGKFMLSFWPSTKVKIRHEYITPTPKGFRYRQEIHITTAALFKYFKDHYNEQPPPPPDKKEVRKNLLANLMKNLNTLQLQELKNLNKDNSQYTPSDLNTSMDNSAHTPSELPFQTASRPRLSRVPDKQEDFKRPPATANDLRSARGKGRGAGHTDNRRNPDRSPDTQGTNPGRERNNSGGGWGDTGGNWGNSPPGNDTSDGGWGSPDRATSSPAPASWASPPRDKPRSPQRRNNVWGQSDNRTQDRRGGRGARARGGRGRGDFGSGRGDFGGGRGDFGGGRGDFGGGRGDFGGGRGDFGGGRKDFGGARGRGRGRSRDNDSWGSRGGRNSIQMSRVHDSPPRGRTPTWNNSPPRMQRQSSPTWDKSETAKGSWGSPTNKSPPRKQWSSPSRKQSSPARPQKQWGSPTHNNSSPPRNKSWGSPTRNNSSPPRSNNSWNTPAVSNPSKSPRASGASNPSKSPRASGASNPSKSPRASGAKSWGSPRRNNSPPTRAGKAWESPTRMEPAGGSWGSPPRNSSETSKNSKAWGSPTRSKSPPTRKGDKSWGSPTGNRSPLPTNTDKTSSGPIQESSDTTEGWGAPSVTKSPRPVAADSPRNTDSQAPKTTPGWGSPNGATAGNASPEKSGW